MLINKWESTDLKHLKDCRALGIYDNIEEHDPNKERKILILFDDMIADMIGNKNLI